ncbi:hypothetical protein RCH16_000602 [Cryobacterium sp. MP_M5]|uniref:hypothetical protein n=1 Tax=unclassified Cryobacterium TaxID=2649013 RepID=UPI0018C9A9EB|nr:MULTISPECIES: hypothetical protein [unclassified Cryobacterium]MBG6057410.1 hypothetical protein [Cryobacterium sp. MP_M3]MEC5175609.1 hypothetical protein [Cryobacterium sp. MP_M5]
MLLLAGFALAGCAGAQGGSDLNPSGSPGPPLSSTPPPTMSPSAKPPKEPSDLQGAAWRAGTVTVGGTGPCYGFLTDDGAILALYSEAGLDLTPGAKLTVQVSPASFTADCGPGLLMRLISVRTD